MVGPTAGGETPVFKKVCGICLKPDDSSSANRLQDICTRTTGANGNPVGGNSFHPKCIERRLNREMEFKCPTCKANLANLKEYMKASPDPQVRKIESDKSGAIAGVISYNE